MPSEVYKYDWDIVDECNSEVVLYKHPHVTCYEETYYRHPIILKTSF